MKLCEMRIQVSKLSVSISAIVIMKCYRKKCICLTRPKLQSSHATNLCATCHTLHTPSNFQTSCSFGHTQIRSNLSAYFYSSYINFLCTSQFFFLESLLILIEGFSKYNKESNLKEFGARLREKHQLLQ